MNKQKEIFISDTRAVSEVIGEVLMTAIAVLAFSVIAVAVFSYAGPQEKIHADIQGWVDADSNTINFRHIGGETIRIADTGIIVDINGTRREISPEQLQSIKGSDTWRLGEQISINTSSIWGDSLNETASVATTLLHTKSQLVIKSGTLFVVDSSASEDSGNGTPPQPSAPTDYIAWWSLNENTGNVASDPVGNHDGSISGASWTTGINSSALDFNRNDEDYVQINERIVSDYPFTISVWLKSTSSSDQAVVNLADSSVRNSYYGLYLRNGRARIMASNTDRRSRTGIRIDDGQWHHVVGVFAARDNRTLYVDGVFNINDSRSVTFNTNADRWTFGRWGDSRERNYFDGTIDEVKLWNRSLNSTEVELLYLNP
ncbi:LamG-like jellyroll fold domain-containing protein [Methanolobus sp. ZRKC2]|uniref:LamG-like jellyroll fold domain-containing protein n=1 Tax=Methanolobus sp. ZRKC2 TaxID=3125783 RepID=UPI00324815AA